MQMKQGGGKGDAVVSRLQDIANKNYIIEASSRTETTIVFQGKQTRGPISGNDALRPCPPPPYHFRKKLIFPESSPVYGIE